MNTRLIDFALALGIGLVLGVNANTWIARWMGSGPDAAPAQPAVIQGTCAR
jgi:hypothetical protein